MNAQQRKQKLQATFDTVAPGYDHPALQFFQQTANRMLHHLAPNSEANWLDVATGTGMVALAAASRSPTIAVTGIDLSNGMLAQARAKAEALHLHNIRFRQMDMEEMDFAQDEFDIATSSFGLFFIEDMGAAMQRIANTVKPGGKIAISSFATSSFSPFSERFLSLYEAFGKQAPPLAWQRLADVSAIERIYQTAGITDIAFYQEPLGYSLKSEQQWWDIVWNAGFRGLLSQLSASEQEAFKTQHLEEIRTLILKGENWLDITVNIAIGTK